MTRRELPQKIKTPSRITPKEIMIQYARTRILINIITP